MDKISHVRMMKKGPLADTWNIQREEQGMNRHSLTEARGEQSHHTERGHCFKKTSMAMLKMDDCWWQSEQGMRLVLIFAIGNEKGNRTFIHCSSHQPHMNKFFI